VFGDYGRLPRAARNHLWLMFKDPGRRDLLTDWEEGTRLMVAKFRADSARHLGDPAFEELIDALRSSSPEFRRLWERHEVARSGVGRKVVNHPTAGRLVFEHAVFTPAECTDQRMVLYSPLPEEDTPRKLADLLEDYDSARSSLRLAPASG